MIQFSATQTVRIDVPEQPFPIRHYLRQSQRLVHALVDPSRVTVVDESKFRLTMRPLSFMMLKIQPVVDLAVWPGAQDTLYLESRECQILGNEYIDQRFDLKLTGHLKARSHYRAEGSTKAELTGRADLCVMVDLPPSLGFTPKPLLEATGNGLLHSVLLTIKQRLTRQLVADYYQWASAQTALPPSTQLPSEAFSPQSSSNL